MKSVNIKDKVVLVTGANRGIGKAFVEVAVVQGAKKVYAGARNADSLKDLVAASDGNVIPLTLDVTKADQITAAAEQAGDVEILINNAGVGSPSGFSAQYNSDVAESEMNVNYWGTLNTTRAFVPSITKSGGAIVNILSIASLSSFPMFAPYSASKAALHSQTQAIRAELAAQGVAVAGVYPGPIDTDMAKGLDFEKESPENVAKYVYNALSEGKDYIYPDAYSQDFDNGMRTNARGVEEQNGQMAHQPA